MSRKNNSFLKVKDSSSSGLSKWYGYPRMKIRSVDLGFFIIHKKFVGITVQSIVRKKRHFFKG
ncbi:hypothetical protein EI200_07810 [Peribacillus simplex]|uniref:hypothetical protein n=1 Tax=Peribacillus simplex TaxID=1478 RepID=UPI000F632B8A|nr:hypothetical protein [Peribacillus simplex]RRN72473.1 hypothetical protein EI200_07810 [Peribacillus simplex]